MLEIALLIFTINANGDTRVTVSSMDDLETCQESLATVSGILEGAGSEIVKMVCARTGDRLTAFDHGMGVEDEVYQYQLDLFPDRFTLTLYDDENCTPKTDGDLERYCTVSSQRPLEN